MVTLNTQYLHPKYWLQWIAIGLAYLISLLPFNWQLALGGFLGKLGYYLARDRKHIVSTNVRLCFPDLSTSQQQALVKAIFSNSGKGLIETGFSWLRNPARLQKRFTIHGLSHLTDAAAAGKGVLLVGMHFSTLDLCGALLSQRAPFDVMYRRNKNLLIEALMTRGREKNHPHAIERSDIRGVLKALKQGHIVWYGPDQDYGPKHSVFAPFFGRQAATITATARIAKISGAPVVVFSHRRTGDNQYIIELSSPLEDYPSGDEVTDASRINLLIEEAVKQAPDQYWWVHRRFKTPPPGSSRPY